MDLGEPVGRAGRSELREAPFWQCACGTIPATCWAVSKESITHNRRDQNRGNGERRLLLGNKVPGGCEPSLIGIPAGDQIRPKSI